MRAISLPSSSGTYQADDDDGDMEDEEDQEIEEEEEDGKEDEDEVDMEDIGGAAPRKKEPQSSKSGMVSAGPPQMLTPLVRSSLTKQGYKLIGSHSGVKMCRWTKR